MLLRAMVTVPSSSGWRSTSRTLRGNSGSSSRNSTPLCARLTSPGRGVPDAAAEQAGVGDGVVRGAEGTAGEQAGCRARAGRRRCGLGGFERFVEGERRQDAGEALGEHRLAGAGRADHQDVVAAGGGDLEGALGGGLAANVGESRARHSPAACALGAIGDGRLETVRLIEKRHDLGEVAACRRRARPRPRRLRRRSRPARAGSRCPAARADGDGERAAHGPDGAVEREFAHEQVLIGAG